MHQTWLTETKYRQLRTKNLTKKEFQAIRALKGNDDIIVKPADKGSAAVIMDKVQYITQGQRKLSNALFYEPTDTGLTGEVLQKVNLHAHDM